MVSVLIGIGTIIELFVSVNTFNMGICVQETMEGCKDYYINNYDHFFVRGIWGGLTIAITTLLYFIGLILIGDDS